jgi:hypothetical protein
MGTVRSRPLWNLYSPRSNVLLVCNGAEIPTEELPLQRAAATGSPVFGAFTLVLQDGTERHMIGNTPPLFGEDGKPRGAVGGFRGYH